MKERLSKLQKDILKTFDFYSKLYKKEVLSLSRNKIAFMLSFITEKPYRILYHREDCFEKGENGRMESKIMSREFLKMRGYSVGKPSEEEKKWRERRNECFKKHEEYRTNQVVLTKSLNNLAKKKYLVKPYPKINNALEKIIREFETTQGFPVGRKKLFQDDNVYSITKKGLKVNLLSNKQERYKKMLDKIRKVN